MSTLEILVAIAVTLVAVAFGIVAKRISSAWFRFRGQRLVTCPTDQRSAGVVVDAGHAALTAWGGNPRLRLAGCTHWPERAGCGQACLSQIQASPHDCLIRSVVAKWYEQKCCVRCGRPVEEFYWQSGEPALLLPDGTAKEWNQISADELPETLAESRPLCFGCFVQEVTRPLTAEPLHRKVTTTR